MLLSRLPLDASPWARAVAHSMFTTTGLFRSTPCPEINDCARPECAFSHDRITKPTLVRVPVTAPPKPVAKPVASTSAVKLPAASSSIPAKRPASAAQVREPPTKQAKVGTSQRQLTVPTANTSAGPPILSLNAAKSQVPVPVRQTMLKSLYDHFLVLYQHENIQSMHPNLAAEHALKQEAEVYAKSNKFTYRNAIVISIAAIKKRELPDSVDHPSVGTNDEVIERNEKKEQLENLRLTTADIEALVLSKEKLVSWGYMVEIPDGPGGERLSETGNSMRCERCGERFQVIPDVDNKDCSYHWGKKLSVRANDGRIRIYSCCSREGEGCTSGPHVFYESEPTQLHARHPFSFTKPVAEDASSVLDICCLDCEMVYTTAGMSIARVSVVDGSGKEVFDEQIRLDEGVDMIDYNTRWSGIQPDEYAKAALTLSAARAALDALISTDTIIIGHALDNDLRALRMIHLRCVDTVTLFPHRMGAPYRMKLRDLVKQHLGQTIQSGGADVGHSSLEDSVATLDLVRHYVLNARKAKPPAAPKPSSIQIIS